MGFAYIDSYFFLLSAAHVSYINITDSRFLYTLLKVFYAAYYDSVQTLMPLKLLAPSWEEIQQSCLEISFKTKTDGFKPDIIVGVARGGWIPARIIADILGIGNLTSLGISFYTDIATTEKKPTITQPISTNLEGKVALMVDDVADTGQSLKVGRDHVAGLLPRRLKIATIYKKPWSIITPDYYTTESGAWIIFPWEQAESTRSLKKKLTAEGLSPNEIKQKLLNAGLNKAIVEAIMK